MKDEIMVAKMKMSFFLKPLTLKPQFLKVYTSLLLFVLHLIAPFLFA